MVITKAIKTILKQITQIGVHTDDISGRPILFCQRLFKYISWDLNELVKEETQAKLTTLENNHNNCSFQEQNNYWASSFHKQALKISACYAN